MSAIEKYAVSLTVVVLLAIGAGIVHYLPASQDAPAVHVDEKPRGIQGPSAVFADF